MVNVQCWIWRLALPIKSSIINEHERLQFSLMIFMNIFHYWSPINRISTKEGSFMLFIVTASANCAVGFYIKKSFPLCISHQTVQLLIEKGHLPIHLRARWQALDDANWLICLIHWASYVNAAEIVDPFCEDEKRVRRLEMNRTPRARSFSSKEHWRSCIYVGTKWDKEETWTRAHWNRERESEW